MARVCRGRGYVLPIPEVIQGNTSRGIYDNPQCSLLEKYTTWSLDFLYPDGTVPPVNDAHVGGLPSRREVEIAAGRFGNQKAVRYLIDHPESRPEGEPAFEALFSEGKLPEGPGAAFA